LANEARPSVPCRTHLISTIKARQADFHDCIDSEDLLRKCFRRFRELRFLRMPAG
jgi:hypothetical protein